MISGWGGGVKDEWDDERNIGLIERIGCICVEYGCMWVGWLECRRIEWNNKRLEWIMEWLNQFLEKK